MLSTRAARAGAGLFAAAMLIGSVIGATSPDAGAWLGERVDPAILLLVATLFFTLRLRGVSRLRRVPRTVALAVGVNFAVIPVIAFALTRLLPDDALRLGVLIYCLAPCTNWFLGFTRLAGGDTIIGAALIPLQMTLQLVLYPVWLLLFAGRSDLAAISEVGPTLLGWFVVPALAGLALRALVQLALPGGWAERVVDAVDRAVPWIISAVIVTVFAANVGTIVASPAACGLVLLVVFLFFVTTYVAGEAVSRLFRLRPAERALLTMTTSARNAPLMLAITTIALPDQPVVQAAIILGMLIEFPHLSVITQVLRRAGWAQSQA